MSNGNPSRAERHRIQMEVLESFIRTSEGLSGMVLVGLRELEESTAVEVSAACSIADIYRAMASMCEAMLRGGAQGHTINNEGERKIISLIADVLLAMSGDSSGGGLTLDSSDQMAELSEFFEKNRKN